MEIWSIHPGSSILHQILRGFPYFIFRKLVPCKQQNRIPVNARIFLLICFSLYAQVRGILSITDLIIHFMLAIAYISIVGILMLTRLMIIFGIFRGCTLMALLLPIYFKNTESGEDFPPLHPNHTSPIFSRSKICMMLLFPIHLQEIWI